ncbi:hypothetical protein DFJ77DRAFT_128707 [Powellomyces hirtus]|nr:hypothetical protein DFJ77DRAFT_128707 [Powellomyces hirtus]
MGCGASTRAGAPAAGKAAVVQKEKDAVTTSPQVVASADTKASPPPPPTTADNDSTAAAREQPPRKPLSQLSVPFLPRDNPGSETLQSPISIESQPPLQESNSNPNSPVPAPSATSTTNIKGPHAVRNPRKPAPLVVGPRDQPGNEILQSPVSMQALPVLKPKAGTAQKPAELQANSHQRISTAPRKPQGQTFRPAVSVFVTTAVTLDHERKVIDSDIFPRARESGARADIAVDYVDFRAALPPYTPSDPSTLGSAVTEIKTRPYFMGIVGGPRGWRPDLNDARDMAPGSVSVDDVLDDAGGSALQSAVEMEIVAGIRSTERGCAVVYVRSPRCAAEEAAVPEEWGSVVALNTGEDTDESWTELLRVLKARHVLVRVYESISELSGFMTEDLERWIGRESTTRDCSNDSSSVLMMRRIAAEAVVTLHEQHAARLDSAMGVLAISGYGATSFAASWATAAERRGRQIIPYFCGLGHQSMDAVAVLASLTQALSAVTKPVTSLEEAVAAFHAALVTPPRMPTTILVCGVDYLDANPTTWIPHSNQLPTGTTIIVTSSKPFQGTMTARSDWTHFALPHPAPALRSQLLAVTRPPVSPSDVGNPRNQPLATDPFVLTHGCAVTRGRVTVLTTYLTAVEEKFGFEQSDLVYPSSDPIPLALNLPSASDGTTNPVAGTLAIVWATRQGQCPQWLMIKLLGIPHRTWIGILQGLEQAGILAVSPHGSTVGFAHPAAFEVVGTRYIATQKRQTGVLRDVAAALKTLLKEQGGNKKSTEWIQTEIAWMLARGGDGTALNSWIERSDVVAALSPIDLARLQARAASLGADSEDRCQSPQHSSETSAPEPASSRVKKVEPSVADSPQSYHAVEE